MSCCALRLLNEPWHRALLLTAFPASLWNAVMGQTSALFLLLLVAGVAALGRRPLLTGAFFALACFKPHLAAVLPIALLAGGYYRALLSFIASGLLLVFSTMVYWSPEVWWAYLSALLNVRDLTFNGAWGFFVHLSAYAYLRGLGLDHGVALFAHTLYAGAWIAVLAMAWRRKRPLEVRLTLLVLSALSLSPYALAHDLVLLIVPMAFLLRRQTADARLCPMDAAVICLWLMSYYQSIWVVPAPFALTLVGALFLAMPFPEKQALQPRE
jgi:hypothetical protein